MTDNIPNGTQQFFEAAALLYLFHNRAAVRIRSRELRLHRHTEVISWHQALDSLSQLADTDSGGRSTTSLAAVNSPSGPLLLLSSNTGVRERTLDHLKDVLQELKVFRYRSLVMKRQVTDRLFRASVEHGYKKVINYKKQLQNRMQAMHSLIAAVKIPEEQSESIPMTDFRGKAAADLSRLLHLQQASSIDLPTLCRLAYDIMRTKTIVDTMAVEAGNVSRTQWRPIRHLLGRLGTWYKSIKTLTRIAAVYPQYFKGLEVEILNDRVLPCPKPVADDESFERAITAAFPALDINRVVEELQVIQRCDLSGLRRKYLETLGSPHLKPFVHAEVLLADHIFVHRLSFVRGDRYIGCSKPMCYHCQIYLELHPGNFCSGPCHGNLWLKWSPGSLLNDPDISQTLRERMIIHIHRDAQAAMMGQYPFIKRLPDSTSGLSRSIVV